MSGTTTPVRLGPVLLVFALLLALPASASAAFTTTVTPDATLVAAPYTWTFDPGEPSTAGVFWADNGALYSIDGPGPYTYRLPSGRLADGSHLVGHSWRTSAGTWKAPPKSFRVTVSNPAVQLGSKLPGRLPAELGQGRRVLGRRQAPATIGQPAARRPVAHDQQGAGRCRRRLDHQGAARAHTTSTGTPMRSSSRGWAMLPIPSH